MPTKSDILELGLLDLQHLIQAQGFEKYRTRQILSWIYTKFVSSFENMTDLPETLREHLSQNFKIGSIELATLQKQKNDQSRRYLWSIDGVPSAESVLLKYKYGLTACLSTQIGCPAGCEFCASGQLDFRRNLTKGEIIAQFLGMCNESKKRIGRVVFMGTGEPFFNYESVLGVVDTLTDPETYDLSRRKITISTVGIPEVIKRFAKDSRGARLAVSLHSASDRVRSSLIPVNRAYPIKEVISAVKYFAQVTGQRITFEYILLKNINDSKEEAKRLAELIKGIDCLVNLIPWNPVLGTDFEGSSFATQREFQNVLQQNRIRVTVRRSLGGNIEAACGQLRRST